MNNFDTIKFQDGDFEMDVNVSLEDNNIWLTIDEMANIFSKGRSAITKQINSLFRKDELEKGGMCAKMEHMVPSLNRTYTKTYYNLDVINSISIKLKSNRGKLLQECLNNYLNSNLEFDNSNQIIIYNNGSLSLPVTISPKEDTVYLNQNQIAELFDTTQPNIAMHIKNIVEEGELTLEATHKYFLLVQNEGGRSIRRSVDYYNLDMILSIGYRVKSKNAIMFRRWVTNILKQYLLKGYVLNNDRISISVDNFVKLENNIKDLESRMTNIEENMFVKPVKEKVFFNGQYFDSYLFINSIFELARDSVVLIDSYFDLSGLDFFRKVKMNVKKTVVLSKKAKLTNRDVDEFKKEYGSIDIVESNVFHDRYIFIDESICYWLGPSLNRLDKVFSIVRFEDKNIIDLLYNFVKALFDAQNKMPEDGILLS